MSALRIFSCCCHLNPVIISHWRLIVQFYFLWNLIQKLKCSNKNTINSRLHSNTLVEWMYSVTSLFSSDDLKCWYCPERTRESVFVEWDKKESVVKETLISHFTCNHLLQPLLSPRGRSVQQEMECVAFALVNTFYKSSHQRIIID